MTSFLNTTTRNVHWFWKAHEGGELEMKPPFQRNPVWLTKQKSFLIDTILSGLPIPEIYMLDSVDSEGSARYTVVDGQQRLRAVLEFLEGRFQIDQKDSPRWAGMEFEDLTGDDKKKLYNYNFVVRQLPASDDAQLRLIFQRLNRNTVSLNAQELRKATYWGPFISLMEEIANEEIWSRFAIFSPNDVRRMLDVEYVSEIAIALLNGHQNKKAKLDHYYQVYEESFEQGSEVKSAFLSVLGEIAQSIPEIGSTRWSKKTDFYTLFLVLSKYNARFPLDSSARKKLRQKVLDFGLSVDELMKPESVASNFERYAREYGAGIRASSDLGSRKRRFEALESHLAPVFSAGSERKKPTRKALKTKKVAAKKSVRKSS